MPDCHSYYSRHFVMNSCFAGHAGERAEAVQGADKHVRLMIAECFAAVRKKQLCKFLPVCPKIRRLGEAVASAASTFSEQHI